MPQNSPQPLAAISTLPERLQSVVPPCAQSCLSTYIQQGFDENSICSGADFYCLCSTYRSYGFTLGELALTCLHISDCGLKKSQAEEQQSVLDICSAQRNAVEATHAILDPPSTTLSSSRRTTPGISQTQTPTAATTVASSTELQPPTPVSSSASTASAFPSNAPGSTGLTSAQAIGISIAAVVFVVLVVAFGYILAYCRRQNQRKQVDLKHPNNFSDGESRRSWLNFRGFKESHMVPAGPYNGSPSEKRQTAWPSPHAQHIYYQSHEKAANGTRSISRESYRSSSSIRTASRLLPEKPAQVRLRPPKPVVEPVTVQTPATVFEEDIFLIVPRTRTIPSLPKNPRQPQYAHQFKLHPEVASQAPLALTIPRQPSRPETTETAESPPPPQAIITTPFYGCSKATSSTNSFLNYYEGPDSGSPEYYYPITPIDRHSQVRRPAPAAINITRPMFSPVAVRASAASDDSRRTSFESTDPDEATPPDEADEPDKRLTPVAESPISNIRYPKIPRGSNQTVPRSPEQRQYSSNTSLWNQSSDHITCDGQGPCRHHPSRSGSTLAAKRVGDHAAHGLKKGLRIATTGAYLQEGDRHPREHGSAASDHSPANWPLPFQEPLKSPPWEPKLTPRRLGEDVYLSVSVATPVNSHFSHR